jgi:DNA invertase Pin-like site-specific DNA recombinase
MKVVGYGRCSTAEQASNGVSIEVQRRAVERIAQANGWDLTWLADEGVSGAVPPESRKRFKAALALLEAGESEALIFTKVDRASRCTEDFARLIRLSEEQDWRLIFTKVDRASRRTEDFARLIRLSEEQDWRLIVTEMGIDTRTPMGKAMAHWPLCSPSWSATSSGSVPARRCRSRRAASRSADQDRRQTTWWPGLCGSARRARPRRPLPATSTRTPRRLHRVRAPGRKLRSARC